MSALQKSGLDDLLEKIQLQADVLELKANPSRPAEGVVIESQMEKGMGKCWTKYSNSKNNFTCTVGRPIHAQLYDFKTCRSYRSAQGARLL